MPQSELSSASAANTVVTVPPMTFTSEELAPMLSALTHWVGGDLEILLDTLPDFLASAPTLLESLRLAIARGHAPSARRAAHTIKGLLASCVVPVLAASAARIENLASANALPEVSAALAVLAAGLEEVYAKIRAIIEMLRHGVG